MAVRPRAPSGLSAAAEREERAFTLFRSALHRYGPDSLRTDHLRRLWHSSLTHLANEQQRQEPTSAERQ